MPDYPPFMNAYGTIPKILNKIKEAKTPDRFTQDFLSTVLGFSGGSRMAFIPLAKRIGLLASDGTPTEVYKRFRNPEQSRQAMAEAMRKGYPTLYARNQYTEKLDKKKLGGIVMEATGLDSSASTLRSIVGTFEALKAFADFDGSGPAEQKDTTPEKGQLPEPLPPRLPENADDKLRFSYTINLNLPNTTDIAVFNAIFKSVREHLLKR